MSFFLKIAPVPALAASLWIGLNQGCIASPGDPDGVGFAAQRSISTCTTVSDGQETLPNYHCGNPADAGTSATATTTATPAPYGSLGYYYGETYPYGSYYGSTYGSYYGSPYGSYGYGYGYGYPVGSYGAYGAYGTYGSLGGYYSESGPDEPGYAPGDVGPPGNCGCGGAMN